jgi:hypothetical protein
MVKMMMMMILCLLLKLKLLCGGQARPGLADLGACMPCLQPQCRSKRHLPG